MCQTYQLVTSMVTLVVARVLLTGFHKFLQCANTNTIIVYFSSEYGNYMMYKCIPSV